jgi:hypothetical protein
MLNRNGAQLQVVEVDDFSGGMTDNILGAPPNKFEKADNFFLQKVGGKARLITRPAVRAYTSARLATATRVNHLFDIEAKLFQISNKKVYENSTTAFTEIAGPTNSAFNLGDDASKYAVSVWQKHALIANDAFSKVIRLYNNGTNWTINNLGLPALSAAPTFLASSVGTTCTYGYAFHYFTEYSNQSVTFAEQGAITFASAQSNVALGGGNTITITPHAGWTITNGADDNYLLANLKIKIWRTTDGGTTYYYHSTVNYNTGAVVDSTTDATISAITNDVLYTNGADDVPMHEQPPQAKYLHVVNDIMCLAYVKEGSEYIPNKMRFSNRFQPWSCPATFYEEFDEEIIGVSSINIYPIVFCKNKIYRIEGLYLPDGSGGVTKKLISSTAGCLANRSIIKTDIGLFFAGNDGFYYTDGYQVQRISNDLLSSYLDFTNTADLRARITGTYYPKLQSVLWSVKTDSNTDDNDKLYMTYLQAGVSDSMPFTTWSGGSNLDNFMPTALHHVNGVLYFGDSYGYVQYFDHDLYSDHRVDTAASVGDWITTTIVYDYRSVAFDFGQSSVKKWVPKMLIAFENTSSVSMQIYANSENSGDLRALQEIDARGNVEWASYPVEWGDTNLRWNYTPVLTVKRAFPAGSLRCFYRQVIFTNSYAVVETSDSENLIGNATFDGTTNTVTLNDLTKEFPTDIEDYYVSTAYDSYSTQFRITDRTSGTVLALEDTDNVLPTGSYAWKIKGYRRNEVVRIISYAIDYAFTQQTGDVYRADA